MASGSSSVSGQCWTKLAGWLEEEGGGSPGLSFPLGLTVPSVSFLLLHSEAERQALWMGPSLGMGCPSSELASSHKFWPLQLQTTNSFLGRCFIFFFSILGHFIT